VNEPFSIAMLNYWRVFIRNTAVDIWDTHHLNGETYSI
jgi:hypothetical protein